MTAIPKEVDVEMVTAGGCDSPVLTGCVVC